MTRLFMGASGPLRLDRLARGSSLGRTCAGVVATLLCATLGCTSSPGSSDSNPYPTISDRLLWKTTFPALERLTESSFFCTWGSHSAHGGPTIYSELLRNLEGGDSTLDTELQQSLQESLQKDLERLEHRARLVLRELAPELEEKIRPLSVRVTPDLAPVAYVPVGSSVVTYNVGLEKRLVLAAAFSAGEIPAYVPNLQVALDTQEQGFDLAERVRPLLEQLHERAVGARVIYPCPYTWVSYSEQETRLAKSADGLDRIASFLFHTRDLIGQTREWILAHEACHAWFDRVQDGRRAVSKEFELRADLFAELLYLKRDGTSSKETNDALPSPQRVKTRHELNASSSMRTIKRLYENTAYSHGAPLAAPSLAERLKGYDSLMSRVVGDSLAAADAYAAALFEHVHPHGEEASQLEDRVDKFALARFETALSVEFKLLFDE